MKRRIEFLSPDFNAGENLTVQDGLTWADARPGDLLNIYGIGEAEPDFPAVVTRVTIVRRDDLTDSDLQTHDRPCARVSGLSGAMRWSPGLDSGPLVVLLRFFVPWLIPECADQMTVEEFKGKVDSGLLIGDEGCGYYASATHMTRKHVDPSDIKINGRFSHVVWFDS